MLSIIIPTLNEEKNLLALLESIKKQGFSDYEIIVADAGSKDATVSIAQQYGCAVCEGGLPAKARNNGSKIAKGNVLFFLDADTLLADNFLQKTMDEFARRRLTVASFKLKSQPHSAFEDFLLDAGYNWMMVALENVLAHGATGIVIEKSSFEQLSGYDETITLAEDHDLVRRAAKIGKFGVIRSVNLYMSTRRFKKDGWITTGIKFFLCQLHMIFLGPVRSNIFSYKFNHYQK